MTHTCFITAVSALTSDSKEELGLKGFTVVERFSSEVNHGKANLEQLLLELHTGKSHEKRMQTGVRGAGFKCSTPGVMSAPR